MILINTHTCVKLLRVGGAVVSRDYAEAQVWCEQRSRVFSVSVHELGELIPWVYGEIGFELTLPALYLVQEPVW